MRSVFDFDLNKEKAESEGNFSLQGFAFLHFSPKNCKKRQKKSEKRVDRDAGVLYNK